VLVGDRGFHQEGRLGDLELGRLEQGVPVGAEPGALQRRRFGLAHVVGGHPDGLAGVPGHVVDAQAWMSGVEVEAAGRRVRQWDFPPIEYLDVHLPGQQAAGLGIDDAVELVQVEADGDLALPDDGAHALHPIDQPLGSQQGQRVADRGSGDTELRHELFFGR